ncbi:cytochrome c biogenesis CcdA family protein [Paenibacillus alginolyticus]|uniref:Cytochrome c biogenesis protein CcdA n=1 Tax=Paenibacillus alginolyticus TaxID=59839 RepID=A0ABT4GIZ3_9BACL|nr:cytochrome c biogenesis protein CcdA [Paenibacillus alginolyticus]MCY9696145.1 cytochrome c biogenesis protein CcdA [Paenibacillus alginolyticus]MEC0143298.1 cytochrome c biogenesis protein CcdA [Paenibacillus alginolyticus]
MNSVDLSLWLAFGAGFLSFISPCCLPLYPTYLSYITGISVKDLKEGRGLMQRRAILHTLFFVMGFSIIFFALGLSASLIGDLFSNNRVLIQKLGGILVAVMGLVMLGLFQPQFLMREKRLEFKGKPTGYVGSLLVGVTFAAGWTPCIGPILSAILTIGVTRPDQALWYICSYIVGFVVPFFIMAFFIGKMKWIQRYSTVMMKIGGAMMVVTGILLYTDQMTKITIWLIQLYGGFTGF